MTTKHGRFHRMVHFLVRQIWLFLRIHLYVVEYELKHQCPTCDGNGDDLRDPGYDCEKCEGTGIETIPCVASANEARLLRVYDNWLSVTPTHKLVHPKDVYV